MNTDTLSNIDYQVVDPQTKNKEKPMLGWFKVLRQLFFSSKVSGSNLMDDRVGKKKEALGKLYPHIGST